MTGIPGRTCHRNPAGSDHPRLLNDTHHTDQFGIPTCDTNTCAGCVPCPDPHCTLNTCPNPNCTKTHCPGRHTAPGVLVCPTCTRHIRDDLNEIVRLTARPDRAVLSVIEVEALKQGVTSDAAILAGPTADPETFSQRKVHARRHDDHTVDADNLDEPVPSWVLKTWDQIVRTHLNQPTTLRPTTHRTADYLDQALTHLVRDPDFPTIELAHDVRDCRTTLERVLREGDQIDRGAPCPMCGKAALVLTYGTAPEHDRWVCPTCHARYEDTDYRNKVEAVYVLNAQALPASQIRTTYRVPEQTVRKWALRGHVHTRGKDDAGRQLYDVADVLARRDRHAEDTAGA